MKPESPFSISAPMHKIAQLGRRSRYPVTSEILIPASLHLRKDKQLSATHIARSLPHLNIDVSAISAYFGCLGEDHALHLAYNPLGFDPTEPQLTKAIAHLLGAEGNLPVSRRRTRAFLKALLTGASNQDANLAAINAMDQATALTIESECPLNNGRRIDLLFQWELPGGARFALAIEAKFGHKVTPGQLPAYRKQVNALVKNGHWALVLLTPKGRTDLRNKDWIALTWRTVLTRWECLLDEEERKDASFALLRKLIWDKL